MQFIWTSGLKSHLPAVSRHCWGAPQRAAVLSSSHRNHYGVRIEHRQAVRRCLGHDPVPRTEGTLSTHQHSAFKILPICALSATPPWRGYPLPWPRRSGRAPSLRSTMHSRLASTCAPSGDGKTRAQAPCSSGRCCTLLRTTQLWSLCLPSSMRAATSTPRPQTTASRPYIAHVRPQRAPVARGLLPPYFEQGQTARPAALSGARPASCCRSKRLR